MRVVRSLQCRRRYACAERVPFTRGDGAGASGGGPVLGQTFDALVPRELSGMEEVL